MAGAGVPGGRDMLLQANEARQWGTVRADRVTANRVTRAKRYIDRHLADRGLSPVAVAAALGVSVRTLHLAFAPTGVSFGRHVLRRRLEKCRAALLADPGRAVSHIAFAWGFASLSSFYRAFQAAFGVSPGEARVTGAARSDGDHISRNET